MRRPPHTIANTSLRDPMPGQRARTVPWISPDENTPRRENGLRTLRVQRGGTHLIRFIKTHVQFYRYFVNGRTAICATPLRAHSKRSTTLNRHRFSRRILQMDDAVAAETVSALGKQPSVEQDGRV